MPNTHANLHDVLKQTDWALLASQKLSLLNLLGLPGFKPGSLLAESLTGLLNWIDALQDAAHDDGYPVVFLTDNEVDDIDTQGGAE